jgi:hypothetical protein
MHATEFLPRYAGYSSPGADSQRPLMNIHEGTMSHDARYRISLTAARRRTPKRTSGIHWTIEEEVQIVDVTVQKTIQRGHFKDRSHSAKDPLKYDECTPTMATTYSCPGDEYENIYDNAFRNWRRQLSENYGPRQARVDGLTRVWHSYTKLMP